MAPSDSKSSSAWSPAQARRRLRITAILFLVLLSIPIGVLLLFSMYKLYQQTELQMRFAAEQAADSMQRGIIAAIDQEEARPFADYSFYTATNVEFASQQAVRRSPLSELNPPSAFPGTVGYFQLSPDGELSSPLLPAGWAPGTPAPGVPEHELQQRITTLVKIEEVLSLASDKPGSGSAKQPPAARPSSNATADSKGVDKEAVDRLNAARFSQEKLLKKQMDLDRSYQQSKSGALPQGFGMRDYSDTLGNSTKQKLARKENAAAVDLRQMNTGALQEAPTRSDETGASHATANRLEQSAPKITSFEAEVDPFQVMTVEDRYTIFFRKTWRDSKRIIQGVVVETRPFLERFAEDALTGSSLPPASSIAVTEEDKPVLSVRLPGSPDVSLSDYSSRKVFLKGSSVSKSYGSGIPDGRVVFQTALPAPVALYQVYFIIRGLPLPAGSVLVIVLAVALSLILLLGTLLLYRLGSAQITLAQKRNDFVSAVSHELKTPLTSIRMYGEMLKNDWVPEEGKKRAYYEYIFQESERLSRLIGNVLRLSKLGNGHDRLELVESTPKVLLESIRQKVEQITKAAGFTLTTAMDPGAESAALKVDEDGLSQIAINLVDNAVKFSKEALRKEIEIGFRREESSGTVLFFVRDFGPGVAVSEQRKIFGLFYRSENELTRKTSGTGIGLALVKELASGMGATADYRGRDPGAEFRILFRG